MKIFDDEILRKLNFCVLPKHTPEKIRVVEMVHLLLAYVLIVFNEIKHLKRYFRDLVTISIPKVVKNDQKVPILANFEIRLSKQ